jgi:tetratricopeptide (TPR) repeat protein
MSTETLTTRDEQLAEPEAEAGDHTKAASRGWMAPSLIVATGAVVYLNSFNGQMIFDDVELANDLSIRTLWPPWHSMLSAENVARPLVGLSFAVNYAISGLEVWSYHLVNLSIHLLAGLLLFGVVRRTLETPRLIDRFGKAAAGLALAIALIWVAHPLQTESVTYIIQRAEAMVGCFYLLTLYCVIRGNQSARPARWYVAAVGGCLAGMATKPVMVTAPLIVLAWELIFGEVSFKGLLRRKWALYLGLASTWLVLALTVVASSPKIESAGFNLKGITPWAYLRSEFAALLQYLKLALWPYDLCLDYNWRPASAIGQILPYAIPIVALAASTVWMLKRKPEIGFLGLWFFLILAPTSSVMPLLDIVVEHRMYLPLAAVIAIAVLALYRVVQRMRDRNVAAPSWLLPAALAIVISWLGSLTIERNVYYGNKVIMWADVVRKQPNNPRAQSNLGLYLYEIGDADSAVEHLEKALELSPKMPDAHNNIGMILADNGRSLEAIPHFEQALEIRPDMTKANFNLGRATAALGRWDEAAAAYRRELLVNPHNLEVYRMLGLALEKSSRFDEAIATYEEALREWPNSVEMLCKQALALSHPKAGSSRDPARAVRLGDRALELTGNQQPSVLDIVAAVYASDGKFKEATEMASAAVDLARARADQQLVEVISKRLEQYRSGSFVRQ